MIVIIYIYSNETGERVDTINGADNVECERIANDTWGSNDYYWSYTKATGEQS